MAGCPVGSAGDKEKDMFKKIVLAIGVFLGATVLLHAGNTAGFAQGVVALPPELAAAITGGVFFVVSLLLQGRIPDEYVEEVSGLIATAVLGIIGVALKLIPPDFEDLANGILNILVILLGMISFVKLLFSGGKRLFVRG
jgi:drug/metabolite transporter (DMT)-like permease